VADGIIDVRSAASALDGFDQGLRYFLKSDRANVELQSLPIPVSIEKASWTAVIPPDAATWLLAILGAGALTYATTAAKKMAENDFKEGGLKDALRAALKGFIWCLKIGKHVGTFRQKRIVGMIWRNNNLEVGVPNDSGEYIFVPRRIFEQYASAPPKLFAGVAKVIEERRTLKAAVKEGVEVIEVTVTRAERHYFYLDEDDSGELLFPDLVHGERVTLKGVVTRGNEKANSIGFEFRDHILTCYPRFGSIVRFKSHLFLPCRITGEISRTENQETPEDRKPKIIFDTLELIDLDHPKLF
jgi:hypothetical protein